MGGNIHDIKFANNFFDMTPKTRQQKTIQNSQILKVFVHQKTLQKGDKATYESICKLYTC